MDAGPALPRPASQGRPRRRPAGLVGDKGYTGRPIRGWLRRKRIRAVIPRLSTASRRGTRFDRATYRQRNRVERLIRQLKRHRRVATRYEKLACRYRAMVTIAAILLYL
jgi:transposase